MRCADLEGLAHIRIQLRYSEKDSNAPRDPPRLGHSNQAPRANFSRFDHPPS
jgi:hypothetical protein